MNSKDFYRIMRKIEKTPGCWLWTAAVSKFGYAQVWLDGRMHPVHRILYETLRGPIPSGLMPDHKCRIRRCVNPSCLDIVTNAENVHRGSLPKLSSSIVKDLRTRKLYRGAISAWAVEFSCSRRAIRLALDGKTWN